MKLTIIKFINLIMLVLSISMTTFARADTEDECQNQSLKPQGMLVAGNTITLEQNVTIPMVSDKGKVEATLELTLNKTKKGVIVKGEIKNTGRCEISTFMPVSLYPIKNGLPIGWHSLPEELKFSNPKLQPEQSVKFSKNYSIDYASGFNIKLGTFTLSTSDASADCSDKALARKLEKIADKETRTELDTCQLVEAMIRINNSALEVLENCSLQSKQSQLLKKEINQDLIQANQNIKNSCDNNLGVIDSPTNSVRSKKSFVTGSQISNCPAEFEQLHWGKIKYTDLFNNITKNKIPVNYGAPGEIDYPYRFYLISRFTPSIDSLKNKNWQDWTKSDWNIVISELQDEFKNFPSVDKHIRSKQLEDQIIGVKCYASINN